MVTAQFLLQMLTLQPSSERNQQGTRELGLLLFLNTQLLRAPYPQYEKPHTPRNSLTLAQPCAALDLGAPSDLL